jgi:hypothetical protein
VSFFVFLFDLHALSVFWRALKLGITVVESTSFLSFFLPDFGVTRPRAIDGPIPFTIARKVAVEDWTGRKDNIAEECIERHKRPVILRNTAVSRWPALAKWTPDYFRTSVPSWKNISRAKALKRCFINFEPNTPLERVTPWEFWENRESREEFPMSMSDWFDKAKVFFCFFFLRKISFCLSRIPTMACSGSLQSSFLKSCTAMFLLAIS